VKISNIKFDERASSGSCNVSCQHRDEQMDRETKLILAFRSVLRKRLLVGEKKNMEFLMTMCVSTGKA